MSENITNNTAKNVLHLMKALRHVKEKENKESYIHAWQKLLSDQNTARPATLDTVTFPLDCQGSWLPNIKIASLYNQHKAIKLSDILPSSHK